MEDMKIQRQKELVKLLDIFYEVCSINDIRVGQLFEIMKYNHKNIDFFNIENDKFKKLIEMEFKEDD